MADRVLREACVHGRYEEHSVMWTDNRTTSSYTSPCLGGREVTIDYEAAADKVDELLDELGVVGAVSNFAGKVIAAALPDREV